MNKHIRGCKNNPANQKNDKDKLIEKHQAEIERQYTQLSMQLQEKEKTIKELQNVVKHLVENQPYDASQETEPSTPTFIKKKKAKIPQAKRILCWNTYIGDTIGKTKCLCCKILDITQFSFNCGHVVSDANGGDISIDNLRPICDKCNTDMGTMDMREFALLHFNNIL
jgi:5-methylcytosine-specific restriction endonuclease McrA